jgi:hypothetical protein
VIFGAGIVFAFSPGEAVAMSDPRPSREPSDLGGRAVTVRPIRPGHDNDEGECHEYSNPAQESDAAV